MAYIKSINKGIDRNVNPGNWNKAWEEYLERKFQSLSMYPNILVSGGRNRLPPSQGALAGIEQKKKELCLLQHDLAEFIVLKRSDYNFDAMWLKMSSKARENHILQGLVISCGVVDMEGRRAWCPETSMEYLQRDNGRGFLNLLATVCPPADSQPQPRIKPILVSNPICDAALGVGEPCKPDENEAARIAEQNLIMTGRGLFITFLLWNTVLHIYGKSETYYSKRVGKKKSDWRVPGSPFTREQELMELEEYKKDWKSAHWSCNNCSTPESQLPEGGKLMECSKCKTVGRKVKYCNRECQTNDWKKGNPPHKTICGKPYMVQDAFQTTPIRQTPDPSAEALGSASGGPPPPDPGYTRSKALLHQVSLMQKHHDDGMEYFLIGPGDEPDVGIKATGLVGFPPFEGCRDQAMKNGDLRSVILMYAHLKDIARGCGIPQVHLLGQLSQEYKIDVDTLTRLVQKAGK